ncbi:hypothetical protein [Vibrio sp. 10N]|uniref:hypothetical protein n=1 Tax=Vibrio sp. 10N TaxID=3058938 RepID=UPI0028134D6D|nr:hypothetical protein VB10N_46200 [Vibrio sp. 10N]
MNATTTRYQLNETTSEWTDSEIRNLCFNMLKEAVREIRDHRKSQQMREEAREWLLSNSQSPFSAINCCDYAGIDIHSLRKNVDRLTNGGLYL